jgi:hypothetical protein
MKGGDISINDSLESSAKLICFRKVTGVNEPVLENLIESGLAGYIIRQTFRPSPT